MTNGDGASAPPPHDNTAEQAVLGACMTAPAVAHHIRRTLPDPNAFYRPNHVLIYTALLELADNEAPTDPIALRDHLDRTGQLRRAGGAPYLHELYNSATLHTAPDYYARIVADQARLRAAQTVTTRNAQRLADAHPHEVTELLDQARADLDKTTTDLAAGRYHVRTVDEFLTAPDDDYDWLLPGLLERQDRMILTGGEGKGKSTFCRQLAVQTAAGVHPFTGEHITPLRVLLLDLENSERQTRRKLRPLRAKAGDHLDPELLRVETRLAGVDLTQTDDVAWLTALVDDSHPDLLITGPIYKMATGDPTEEASAKPVAMTLDRIRARAGCALILEAHSPKATGGNKKRAHEPYGWSGWLRWPEFGIWLDENGHLEHWRGDRDERQWPPALKRGGEWPWTPDTDKYETTWARITQYRAEFGEPMSYRDLAEVLGINRNLVHRAIDRHKDEWERINNEHEAW